MSCRIGRVRHENTHEASQRVCRRRVDDVAYLSAFPRGSGLCRRSCAARRTVRVACVFSHRSCPRPLSRAAHAAAPRLPSEMCRSAVCIAVPSRLVSSHKPPSPDTSYESTSINRQHLRRKIARWMPDESRGFLGCHRDGRHRDGRQTRRASPDGSFHMGTGVEGPWRDCAIVPGAATGCRCCRRRREGGWVGSRVRVSVCTTPRSPARDPQPSVEIGQNRRSLGCLWSAPTAAAAARRCCVVRAAETSTTVLRALAPPPLPRILEMTLVRHCRGALGAMCCALPPRTATPPSPWSLQAGRRCRNGQAHEVGEHATLTARGRRWRAQGPPTRALVRPPRCVHRRSLHRRLNHRHRP